MKQIIKTVGDVRKEKLLANAIEEKRAAEKSKPAPRIPGHPDIGTLNRAGRLMYYVYIEGQYHENFDLDLIEGKVSRAVSVGQTVGS